MVAEVEKRIASGEGLDVKGIKVDTGILLDALELHSGQVGQVGQAPEGPHGTGAAAEKSAPSARWSPSGSSRWSPGEASSSLLSSKAIMECEQAEPFLRSVTIGTIEGSEGSEGSASEVSRCVPVFPRPDVMEKPVEQLGPGPVEVVARFLSRRDGRVYLRLKAATGWVSTRSCEDMALVVLTPKAGEDPLEPAKFRTWPLKSPAMEVLPQVWPESSDAENAVLQGASNDAQNMGSQGKGQSQDTQDVTEEIEEIEEIGNDRNDPNPTEGSEESQASEEAESSEGSAQDHEDLDDLETLEENVQGDNETAKASKSSKALVRKFRIISGRLPVLHKPGMSHLLQSGLKTLQKGESFLADGVFWAKAEQRAYLRMTRGLGWICERSKNDLWRLGIVRISQRKTPVSKKMARAVAFRGGDTGGVIHLQKEDLTKNSRGRIVSKRASEASKKRFNETIGKWTEAVKRARTELNVSGFAVVKKGTELYEKAQEHFKSLKRDQVS